MTFRSIKDLWAAEFSRRGHCCLCGNSGIVDTRGKVFTAAGTECGDKVWCICPNGRAMKRQINLDFPPTAEAHPVDHPIARLIVDDMIDGRIHHNLSADFLRDLLQFANDDGSIDWKRMAEVANQRDYNRTGG
jgi:hypothetical protein